MRAEQVEGGSIWKSELDEVENSVGMNHCRETPASSNPVKTIRTYFAATGVASFSSAVAKEPVAAFSMR